MKKMLVLVLLTLMFLLSGCADDPEEISSRRKGVKEITKSQSIQTFDVSIYPEDPTVTSLITLTADGSFLEGAQIQWYINDTMEQPAGGLNFNSEKLRKEDTVHAVIVKNGKEYKSNSITIKNTPPSIIISELLPEKPKIGSTFTANIKANDVDKDVITYKYKWSVNGKFMSDRTYLNTELKRDDKIAVEITPYDKDDSGKTVRITRKVLNSLPVFEETKPSFEDNLYKYQVAVTDPDNDILAFKIDKGPEGMTIDAASGLITWEVKPEDKGYHEITVRVTDNNGGALLIPITTRIGFK
jgi:hypothetical protein